MVSFFLVELIPTAIDVNRESKKVQNAQVKQQNT